MDAMMNYSEYFKKPRFKANNQEIYYDFYEGAMSDRYAISQYEELFIPKSWHL